MYYYVFAAVILANLIILSFNYMFLRIEESLYYKNRRKLKYKKKHRYKELFRNKRNFNR